MNTLYQHLAGESLSDALVRLENEIKARPADADLRAAFVQFLTLSGNWTRALTQLKSWLALKPQASAGQWTLENDETQTFEWLMDGDARLGPVCETLVNGRYFWLPFSAIAEIRFQASASVTDLVWRHALVRLTDGTEQVCQIPARYPFAADASDAVKLARTTEWLPLDDDGTLYEGLGQKAWLSEQSESPLLPLSLVTFATDGAHE